MHNGCHIYLHMATALLVLESMLQCPLAEERSPLTIVDVGWDPNSSFCKEHWGMWNIWKKL